MNKHIIKTTGLVLSVLLLITGAMVLTGCEDTITATIIEEVRLAELPEYNLTILDPAYGSVTPDGINTIKDGEPLSISATVPGGYSFINWSIISGADFVTFDDANSVSTTVTVSGGDATIQPVISDTLWTLTLNDDGHGVTDPLVSATVANGQPFPINATADTGYEFDTWVKSGGDGTVVFQDQGSASTTVTVTGNHATIEAQFKLKKYTIIISDDGNGYTNRSSIVLDHGVQSSIIIATGDPGYSFLNWTYTSGAGIAFNSGITDSTLYITATGGDAGIRANFEDTQSPTGSLSIQNKINISGIDYRNNRTVDTFLTYSDNSGTVSGMKLSYLSFGTGTSTGWQSVDQSPQYTFNSDGLKTLYLRFRDADGNESALYTDTIYIDSTAPVPSSTEVELIASPGSYPLYVTVWDDTDLQLSYQASDAGCGVQKVYFSNNTTRPTVAQVQNFTSPTVPYPWALTNSLWNFNYYTVSFWFEDKLGNISSRYSTNVRYDDKYEGTSGNTDAVSSATMIMDYADYGTQFQLYNFYNPARGYARLVDVDYYKWGFEEHDEYTTYPASIIFYVNNASHSYTDTPEVTFYDHDGNIVSYTYTYPYQNDSQVLYTFDVPYVDTSTGGGPAYYYLYMRVRKRYYSSTPYSTNWNYDFYWTFDEEQGM